jgi:diphthine-ammonia ligase
MIDAGLHAVLIKVAAMGLDTKHLGKTLAQMEPHLHAMHRMYELNVCGEGGEYESFTLDCPLFVKRMVIDQSEVVMHSDDAFAPVAYLKITKVHLEDKERDLEAVRKLASVLDVVRRQSWVIWIGNPPSMCGL